MPFDNRDEYKKIPGSRKSRKKKREMKEERKEGRKRRAGLPLTAGWQRLNDLPNNKSSGRYDRMQRGPSLGTREPLTSPYLSAKASTCSIPFRRFDPPSLPFRPKSSKNTFHFRSIAILLSFE